MIAEIFQVSGIIIAVCVGLSVLIGNIYYVIRSKNSKIQKEEIAQLQVDNEACNARTAELQTAVNKLQGQIDVLKDIPLKVINKDLASIKISNEKILETLQSSAVALKDDTEQEVTDRRIVARKLKEA